MLRKEKIDEESSQTNTNKQIQLTLFEPLKSKKKETNKIKENVNYKFIIKKRGRKNKFNKILNTEEKSNVHDKFSNDNIKRRIKSLYNKYIITLLNNIVRKKY